MITFQVDDMSCGHCAAAITRAIHQADRDAKVDVDLDAHKVRIRAVAADAHALAEAIREAGYTPVPAA